jgi:hypothetical protein
LLLYLLALATYEIAYPLILVFVLQLLRTRPKCLRTWVCLAVLAVVMAGFQGWLRMQPGEIAYEGIVMDLSPWPVLRTFVLQTFSSLPLAPQIGRRIVQRPGGGAVDVVLVAGVVVLLTVLSGYLALRFFRNRSKENALPLIGMIVWLTPALVIAISAKYQAELDWGTGYLPRYLQNFGLVLVILGPAGRLLTTRSGLAALSLLALLVFTLNVRTIRKRNRDFAAAKLLYSVIEDRSFLRSAGCERLFVIKCYMHDCAQFKELNPSVEVHDVEMPTEGDHVLLIHEGNPGSEWAVFGEYADGVVREPRLVLGERHARRRGNAGTADFKEWTILPLGVGETDYEGLLESVSSDQPPVR